MAVVVAAAVVAAAAVLVALPVMPGIPSMTSVAVAGDTTSAGEPVGEEIAQTRQAASTSMPPRKMVSAIPVALHELGASPSLWLSAGIGQLLARGRNHASTVDLAGAVLVGEAHRTRCGFLPLGQRAQRSYSAPYLARR